MNKRDTEKCRLLLMSMREALKGKLFGEGGFGINTQESAESVQSVPSHLGDVGSEVFDRDMQLKIASGESDILSLVEEALSKIKEGSYGKCEQCQVKINPKRLLVVPYGVNCIECQEKIEQQH